jgi:hypothetical protein
MQVAFLKSNAIFQGGRNENLHTDSFNGIIGSLRSSSPGATPIL